MALSHIKMQTDIDAALRDFFPDRASRTNPKRALICTHNDAVEEANKKILAIIEGENTSFFSVDKLKEEAEYDPINFSHSDFLNMCNPRPGQVPPHKLEVKEGMMAILMRNISRKDKLMNGTRVEVIKIMKRCVIVRTNDNKRHCITRINFEFKSNAAQTALRFQLPLRAAYALTIHKIQGQTMQFVGLDLRRSPFSHGQLYVALGRARSSGPNHADANAGILALVDSKHIAGNVAHTRNIVWTELLPGNFITDEQRAEAPSPSEAQAAWSDHSSDEEGLLPNELDTDSDTNDNTTASESDTNNDNA